MNLLWMIASLVVGAAALWKARAAIRGTTLTATWWWCVIAWATNHIVELATMLEMVDIDQLPALRLAARVLLLCPAVSLLGIKRPQDKAWNFVVASLWAILALPAAEQVFLQTYQPIELHGARSWFLVVLLVVMCVSMLPTRHAIETLFATGAVALLVGNSLPWHWPDIPASTSFVLLALSASGITYALNFPARLAKSSDAAANENQIEALDRIWLDFRDAFGLFWALRVQERLRDAARMQAWTITPTWFGWQTRDDSAVATSISDNEYRAILQTFRGLLRRFVSNEWIDQRMESQPDIVSQPPRQEGTKKFDS